MAWTSSSYGGSLVARALPAPEGPLARLRRRAIDALRSARTGARRFGRGPRPVGGARRVVTDDAHFIGLIAQISHDLRTPLNAIIGFSDIMQRELLGPLGAERYQGYAGHIRESGFALVKAVEDTLALTRLIAESGPGQRGPVDVAACLRHAVAYAGPDAAARDISIAQADIDAFRVLADDQALEQALVNLVLAVVLASAEGARLDITARRSRDTVTVDLVTSGVGATRPVVPDLQAARLPLLVARSLLELQDATLEADGNGGLPWARATLPAGP